MAQTAEKPRTIHEEIEAHRKNGSNILIPFTKLESNEFFSPVIDEVYLSIEQGDAYKRQDAYKNRPEKYALAFQGLNRLAVCAGVQWHPHETRRIDNGADRYYIAYQAVGGLRKADGSMIWHKASYDLDLEVIKEEIEENHKATAKKYNKGDDYVEFCTKRDWRQKRRHKHALAESGAKARVLRSILNVKNLYTIDELKKPFVVIRYVFRPPTDDPAVRRQLINQSIASMQSVYGASTPSLPHYPEKDDYIDIPPPEAAAETPPDESELDPESHPDPEPPPADEPPSPEPEAGPAPEPAAGKKDQGQGPTNQKQDAGQDDRVKDFQAKSKAKQLVEITRLARETGYDIVAVQTNEGVRIDQLSDEQRLDLYKDILSRKK